MRTYTKETLENVRRTLADVDAAYPVAKRGDLLTTSNPKIEKQATERGYLNAALFLAPASMAGVNTCPWSTPECVAGCLNTAGRGGIRLDARGWNQQQAARIRRTARMVIDRDAFIADLLREVRAHARRAERLGLRPALRLNGTSDIPWHRTDPEMIATIREMGVTLYDYTKRPKPDAADHGIDITYSHPGGDGIATLRYLQAGYRVAVVFDTPKGDALPATWAPPVSAGAYAFPVVDGDAHDLRFLDKPGVVVGLRAKGQMRGMTGTRGGFLQPAA